MKLWIKRNKVFMIILVLLISWGIFEGIQYEVQRKKDLKTCYEIVEFLKDNPEIAEKFEFEGCDPNFRYDTFTIFFHLFFNTSIRAMMWLGPMLIVIAAVWNFYTDMKSGYIRNCLTRMSFKKYMIKSYLSSLKLISIIPVFMAVLFLIAFISSGHFDMTAGLKRGVSYANPYVWGSLGKYFFYYFLNLFIVGIVHVNLSLLLVKKSGHILLSIVGGYMVIIGVYLLGEGVIAPCLTWYLGLDRGVTHNTLSFSLYYSYDNVFSQEIMMVYALTIAAISGLGLYFIYRKKEDVVISSEE